LSNPALLLNLVLLAGILILTYIIQRDRSRHSKLETLLQRQQLREDFLAAILQLEPIESNFLKLVKEYLPQYFPEAGILVWRFLENVVWLNHDEIDFSLAEVSAWMVGLGGVEYIEKGERLPWNSESHSAEGTFFAALISEQSGSPIAGISIALNSRETDRSAQAIIQAEADLRFCQMYLNNFLFSMERNEQQREYQSIQQELSIASQIQSDLLPVEYPEMPGWQMSFSLQSAGDLSGDFFDLIPLGESQIGFLIADVAGKGLGAALYMTLCRTLIRTFAKDYVRRPDLVIAETNLRLLEDARDALFVTAFYGVLDFERNELVYANAGHNPPFLLNGGNQEKARVLPLTGLPIGIDAEESWGVEEIKLDQGDFLFLYSDGIPDATNMENETFGNQRLLEYLQAHREEPANVIQDGLLDSVADFSAGAAQFDDMTLLILQRDS
jgi:serine phosphatase RsbU (regulator of sigma subunit)